ncbi:MAG: succinate dehydrogenase, cytochrome b556 subunit [Gemmatimonadota bacterium]|nr:MAG: succinate dehydrogenase, cytochrome b556 subunit [Gemmatimonadota bacterium]
MPERTSFREGLRYRGGTSMWAWMFHRITGLGVLLFLCIHILETFTVSFGPDFYDHTMELYNTVFFRVAEIGLLFAVIYHAINGTRITIQDFWPSLWRYERALVWTSIVILILVFVPLAVWGLLPVFRGEL